MDILEFFERFGWMGVLILWVLPRVWDFFVTRFYPERVKERIEAERAERDAKSMLIKRQIEREERESVNRAALDSRMVSAVEQMALGIAVGNERMTALVASHTQHANFQFGAHLELKERLESIEELIGYRKRIQELEGKLSDTQEKLKGAGDGKAKK